MTVVRAILIGLLAVSIATGCGGDGGSGSSATEWADDVCSSIATWTGSISSAADTLREGNLTEEKLRSAVDDVKTATNDFADDVQALGPPDTDAGEQAQESLETLADDLEANTEKIDKALEDASGPGETLDALTVVTGALSTMGSRLSSTFTELERLDAGGELEDAFREADSCDELSSGSS
jgi:hypothetical protein